MEEGRGESGDRGSRQVFQGSLVAWGRRQDQLSSLLENSGKK